MEKYNLELKKTKNFLFFNSFKFHDSLNIYYSYMCGHDRELAIIHTFEPLSGKFSIFGWCFSI